MNTPLQKSGDSALDQPFLVGFAYFLPLLYCMFIFTCDIFLCKFGMTVLFPHEMQLTNRTARDLYDVQLKYEKGKLGAWFLEKIWQLMWSGKGNKNIVCPMKRKSHINNESSPSIGNSIYFICTLCLNTILSIFIKLLREPLLGQRNFPQKFNKIHHHLAQNPFIQELPPWSFQMKI